MKCSHLFLVEQMTAMIPDASINIVVSTLSCFYQLDISRYFNYEDFINCYYSQLYNI